MKGKTPAADVSPAVHTHQTHTIQWNLCDQASWKTLPCLFSARLATLHTTPHGHTHSQHSGRTLPLFDFVIQRPALSNDSQAPTLRPPPCTPYTMYSSDAFRDSDMILSLPSTCVFPPVRTGYMFPSPKQNEPGETRPATGVSPRRLRAAKPQQGRVCGANGNWVSRRTCARHDLPVFG